MENDFDVIVVGAGVAGLSAAHHLTGRGLRVLLLDKGRQVGGRMASRRFNGSRYDTGAQFFTAVSEDFAAMVTEAAAAGAVRAWYTRHPRRAHHRPLPVWRGDTGMSDLPKWLAGTLNPRVAQIRFPVTVKTVEKTDSGVRVLYHSTAADSRDETSGETVSAPAVILTAPAPQSVALLSESLQAKIPPGVRGLDYHPCVALLVPQRRYPSHILNEHGWVRPSHPAIGWIADNHCKGLPAADAGEPRPEGAALTVHFAPSWSTQWYHEPDRETVSAALNELRSLDIDTQPSAVDVKRWRYAQPVELWSEQSVEVQPGVFLAGDVFAGPRVEGAFSSGLHAARRVMEEHQ